MGSSLSWLVYPNLDLPMSAQARRNDFEFQLNELKVHGDDPNEMMMVMLAVHAAELGDGNIAGEWIARNLVGFLKPPFNVRSVQSFVYGLTGLRIDDKGLSEAYPPVLPDAWKSLTLKNVTFRGQRYDIVVNRDASGKVRLTRTLL